MTLKRVIRYINAMIRDLERLSTFQYDQEPSSPEQYKVWDRRMEENNSVEVFDTPNVQQPREPYYQVQLYGKNGSQQDPSFWTDDPTSIQDDEGMWIDSDDEDLDGSFLEDGGWDVFSDEELEEDGEHTAAPRRRPSKPSAYRKYRQYWRKNRQKYREKKRNQRKDYRRRKNKILRRRKLLKHRTPGRVRPSQSF